MYTPSLLSKSLDGDELMSPSGGGLQYKSLRPPFNYFFKTYTKPLLLSVLNWCEWKTFQESKNKKKTPHKWLQMILAWASDHPIVSRVQQSIMTFHLPFMASNKSFTISWRLLLFKLLECFFEGRGLLFPCVNFYVDIKNRVQLQMMSPEQDDNGHILDILASFFYTQGKQRWFVHVYFCQWFMW